MVHSCREPFGFRCRSGDIAPLEADPQPGEGCAELVGCVGAELALAGNELVEPPGRQRERFRQGVELGDAGRLRDDDEIPGAEALGPDGEIGDRGGKPACLATSDERGRRQRT